MKRGIAFLSTQAASAALLGALATHPLEASSQAALMDPDLAVTAGRGWPGDAVVPSSPPG